MGPLQPDQPAEQDVTGADPKRALAVVTCMDIRIDPGPAFGLEPGDAHVLRNAGGRVTEDVMRSLILSTWLMGARDIAVVHHTSCGLGGGEEPTRQAVADAGGETASRRAFDAFDDLEDSVREDLDRLRDSELLPDDIEVHGYVYDVDDATLEPVS